MKSTVSPRRPPRTTKGRTAVGFALAALFITGSFSQAQTSPAPATTATATTAASTTRGTTRESIAAATAPATDPKITAALGRLGDEDWKARRDAQDELVRFGDEAIPALRQFAATAKDPEARARAEAAVRLIDDTRELGPTNVTIHLKDVAPAAVFDEIARQAHVSFGTWPPQLWTQRPWPTLTVDMDRQPFWSVMQEVSTRTGVQLQQIGNDRRLCVTQGGGNWLAGPSRMSGPFLVIAKTIFRSSAVDLANAANVQREFNVTFAVFPEPKLRVLQASYEAEVQAAVDDKGASLAPTNPWQNNMGPNNAFPYMLTARLNPPADGNGGAGTRLAKIRCVAHFVVQTRRELVEVPDILHAQNVTKVVAGRHLTVRAVRRNGDQCSVEVALSRNGLPQVDWEQFRSLTGQVQLVDDKGRPYQQRGWSGGGSDQQTTYTLEFARDNNADEQHRPGDPAKLLWELSLESREMAVPFEFRDLPLP